MLVIARLWSATPLTRVCTSAPPSSSAVTSVPVAAFTSGGPPTKSCRCPHDTVSSDIAGTYAPPAVEEPITAAICGIPSARHPRLVVEDPTEMLRSGNTSACSGRNAPPESTR